MSNSRSVKDILICGLTPYFLQKGDLWFAQNHRKILEASKTQPFFQDNTCYVTIGLSMHLSKFLRKIDELGYEKVMRITEPGEFSKKGGTVEIFPINLTNAVRIEFYGNTIEGIWDLPIEIKNGEETRRRIFKKIKHQEMLSGFKNAKGGDYVVHLDHGIGIYEGQTEIESKKYHLISYAANDKLYVPLGLERKLSLYIGFAEPKIARLSSPLWEHTKRRIKEGAEKLAKELLDLYAKREITTRPPVKGELELIKEVSSSFPFEETPDQIQTLQDILKDFQQNRPMDRLVCGDVGFGKTEIALRAATYSVSAGYQTAFICPTTILAHQHYQTFLSRLKNLPFEIAMLSRVQTKSEQKRIAASLAAGSIDIVIGTHRILSSDITFKNLGLLIIDDEQRFGVKQKEKLKKMRPSLDVISLSATPIPRTLYLALSSLKNISTIQTPPTGRLPIRTFVLPWKKDTIKKAIAQELKRSGQVYYLHNRIETISFAKKMITELAPGAKVDIIHGRMPEKELILTLEDFRNKKIDILVATTIIENGLDLPNVNTLIVADAGRLGLAQAYQIRGRVGRTHIQANAYFLYNEKLKALAKERLKALEETTELGSGYRVALKDLELRGAGNILGKEQSGHVNQVGLNLYCQILSDAIEKLRQKSL